MKAKKVLAMLMASAMIMGTSVTAFAAAGDITVNTESSTDTFEYTQIIKADNKTETGWAFVSNAIAECYTDAFSASSDQAAIWMLVKAQNPNVTIQGMPKNTVAASASQIATALESVKNLSLTLTESSSKTFNVSTTGAGVYYIMGEDTTTGNVHYTYSPMAAYVGFTYTSAGVVSGLGETEVTAKKVPNKPEKSVQDENKVTAISDTVTFEVNSRVPYVPANDQNRYYYIIDELTGGSYALNANDKLDVTYKVGDQDAVIVEVDPTTTDDGETFTLNLTALLGNGNDVAYNEFANQTIKITYPVTVTSTQVGNNVYGTNSESTNNPKYGSDSEDVYTATIQLRKYASDNNNDDLSDNVKLNDAQFVVYKKVEVEGVETVFYLKKTTDQESGDVTHEWVENKENATKFTTGGVDSDGNAQGYLKVEGLDVGTYWFEEVVAPTGYTVNETDVEVTVTKNDEATSIVVVPEVNMIDTTVSSLPSTGGIGTTIFTIGGCAIMITAAGLYFATRKKVEK